MDELEISGKRYISTRLAGKQHRYHPDYIGQLVRGNKVAGQKVGRSWYVDAESLAAYLSAPSVPVAEEAAVLEEAVVAEAPVSEVEPEREIEKEESEKNEEKIEKKISIRSHLMPRPLQVDTQSVVSKKENFEELQIQEQKDTRHVPITIMARPRLRYIEESERPVFPAVSYEPTSQIEVREEVVILPDRTPKQIRRINLLRPTLAVVIAGCVGLLVVVALSATLISVTTVAGQTASAGYSLKAYSASF
jgi:hypothetical protein